MYFTNDLYPSIRSLVASLAIAFLVLILIGFLDNETSSTAGLAADFSHADFGLDVQGTFAATLPASL